MPHVWSDAGLFYVTTEDSYAMYYQWTRILVDPWVSGARGWVSGLLTDDYETSREDATWRHYGSGCTRRHRRRPCASTADGFFSRSDPGAIYAAIQPGVSCGVHLGESPGAQLHADGKQYITSAVSLYAFALN
jgi:hypothetical protein